VFLLDTLFLCDLIKEYLSSKLMKKLILSIAIVLVGCTPKDNIPRGDFTEVTLTSSVIQSSRIDGHEWVDTAVPAQIKLTEDELISCVAWGDLLKIHYGDNIPDYLKGDSPADLVASDCTTFDIDGTSDDGRRIVFNPLYTDEFKELETLVCEIEGKQMRCARFYPDTPWEAYSDPESFPKDIFQWDVYTVK
jgi:hypothetical protein